MVSIRESMSELEKVHAVQEILLDCYTSAVRDMEQYAVEINDQITPPHKQHLAAISCRSDGVAGGGGDGQHPLAAAE